MQYKLSSQAIDRSLPIASYKSLRSSGNSWIMTPNERIFKNINKKFYVSQSRIKIYNSNVVKNGNKE